MECKNLVPPRLSDEHSTSQCVASLTPRVLAETRPAQPRRSYYHAQNETATIQVQVLRFWVKYTMPYAGTMSYRRDFRPLPVTRVLSENQRKQAGVAFLAWMNTARAFISARSQNLVQHIPVPGAGMGRRASGHRKRSVLMGIIWPTQALFMKQYMIRNNKKCAFKAVQHPE